MNGKARWLPQRPVALQAFEIIRWLGMYMCSTGKKIFTKSTWSRNIRQEAHSYPQADICSAPLSDHNDTHTSSKIASRAGAPQASYDRRRHRNNFQTRPAQAFPKKVNNSEVRGQLMRSNQYRSSLASIYM